MPILLVPDVDKETLKLVDHLNAYINGSPSSESALNEYYDHIATHKYLLQSADPHLNSILTAVMPLLGRIVEASSFAPEYADFLSKLLQLVPLQTAFAFFPKEEMLRAVDYPSPVSLFKATVDLVAWGIKQGDEAAQDFVKNSDLVSRAVNRSLSDHSIRNSCWTVDVLVKLCPYDMLQVVAADLMHAVELVSLLSDSYLTVRYVSIAEIVFHRHADLSKEQRDKIVGVVDPNSFFSNFDDDRDMLLYDVLLNFYTSLVPDIKELPALFDLLSPYVEEGIRVLSESLTDGDPLVVKPLEELVAAVTKYGNEDVLLWITENTALGPLIKQLDLNIPSHQLLFLKIKLKLIKDKQKFYNDQLAQLRLSTIDKIMFPIILRAVEDRTFFEYLAKDEKFSKREIDQLSKDAAYDLLSAISRHDHSVRYLLAEMPSVVQAYLVEPPSDVTNPLIRNTFKEILENILTNDHLDLGHWKAGLFELLNSLYGGGTRGPQVDLMDSAL